MAKKHDFDWLFTGCSDEQRDKISHFASGAKVLARQRDESLARAVLDGEGSATLAQHLDRAHSLHDAVKALHDDPRLTALEQEARAQERREAQAELTAQVYRAVEQVFQR